ncbi:MAG: trigger factor [Kiritimatiellae bacterium]|nr:trigger factor [Kiritimatiellia bacterium]
MKTSAKKLEKCRVDITVKLDAEEVKSVVKDVEKAFLKEASLPGFRPGKVPLELIRKNFADSLKQATRNATVEKYVGDAIKAENIEPLNSLGYRDFTDLEDGASFVIGFEVAPVFKLPTYKGLKIAKADATVADKSVEERLEQLRGAYATYEDAKEGEKAADGDLVQIDYSGTVGGKPILEINAEAKVVASGEGFWTQLEEGRFLPEILKAIKGMKAGETKEGVKAVFDKDAAPEGLKGAKALYKVTLKMIRKRVKPDDAAFAEKAKVANIDELRATIRKAMEEQAVKSEAVRRENDAIDMLLKKVDFDVPSSMYSKVGQELLNQYIERARQAGLDDEYIKKNHAKIMEEVKESALRQIRLWFVFEAIAKAENIEVKEGENIGTKVVDLVLANSK